MFPKSIFHGALAASALLTLAACTTVVAATPAAPHAAGEYVMHPGEKVVLDDHSTLLYARVVNDSRCAPDVQCVWAGDAEVEFQWTPMNGAGQSFSLHTGTAPRQHAIGARTVTLVSLGRGTAPEATVRVDPSAGP